MRKYSVITYREEDSLSIVGNRCSIQGTTTKEGKHYPYLSAFFISQIPINGHLAYSLSEFVKWLISGNKASNRTNNASRSFAVVETISHPTKGRNLLLTKQKRNPTMKTSQKSTALLAVRPRTSIAFAPAMEVNHA